MKVDFAKLDRAFNPRCVAVVGAKPGDIWLSSCRNFKGKLYSVQVDPETARAIEASGIKNYASLLDVPEPVDLVIVTVPRAVAPRILEDCIRKEVAAAHFFTAGFSETGTEEGIRLERLLAEMAEQANFHLIGPNCMGIYNPGLGLGVRQFTDFAAPIGLISQSGTHASGFNIKAHFEGVDINKSVSFGNGIVLDSADYLGYFGRDPEIKVIGMYLEGVKDGRRFFKVLKEVSAKKPVVIWRGGRTMDGGRAIASHTGSLAVPQVIWDAVVKQCRAIKVGRMEELIDTMKALLYLPPVRGDRVGIAGGSGGQAVSNADVFAEAGLRVPLLTQESYDEFATFFDVVGGSYRNPVDVAGSVRRDMNHIIEILERDINIDNLVLFITTIPGLRMTPEQVQDNITLADHVRKRTSKPVMAIVFFYTAEAEKETRNVILRLQEIGVPAFPSIERGACALKNAFDYYQHKEGR